MSHSKKHEAKPSAFYLAQIRELPEMPCYYWLRVLNALLLLVKSFNTVLFTKYRAIHQMQCYLPNTLLMRRMHCSCAEYIAHAPNTLLMRQISGHAPYTVFYWSVWWSGGAAICDLPVKLLFQIIQIS